MSSTGSVHVDNASGIAAASQDNVNEIPGSDSEDELRLRRTPPLVARRRLKGKQSGLDLLEQSSQRVKDVVRAKLGSSSEEDSPSKGSRKRKRKESLHLREVKRVRTALGVGKAIGPRCPDNCRLMCHIFSDEDRQTVFDRMYNEESSQKSRKEFVEDQIHLHEVKRRRPRRNVGIARDYQAVYQLPREGTRVRVCLPFFAATIGMHPDSIKRIARQKMNKIRGAGPVEKQKRGGQNKTPPRAKKCVRKHIKKFSMHLSHYSRADSNSKYIEDCQLNISKMYELYETWMSERHPDIPKVSQSIYRQIFCRKFNIRFGKPRKDECGKCFSYKEQCRANGTATASATTEYEDHRRRAESARIQKNEDKAKAQQDPTTCVMTWDAQQIQLLPKLKVKDAYYHSKLELHNETCYDVGTKNVTMYTWTENEGGVSADEYCTATYMKLKEIDEQGIVKTVIIWADTCAAQNRNKTRIAFLAGFLQESKSINTIILRFFEPGHSHMEVDSVHGAIETATNGVDYWLPSEWRQLAASARRRGGKAQYQVLELLNEDFKGFIAWKDSWFQDECKGIMQWKEIKISKAFNRRQRFIKMETKKEISEISETKNHVLKNVPTFERLSGVSKTKPMDEKRKKSLWTLFSKFGPDRANIRNFYKNVCGTNLDATSSDATSSDESDE